MKFEFWLLRCTSIGERDVAFWDGIFQPVYTKPAEPRCHGLISCSCPTASKNKGFGIGAYPFFCSTDAPEALLGTNTHIVNANNTKSKVPTHSSAYILDTGLCRFLDGNNLSVLPFNIFQELTSLTSL